MADQTLPQLVYPAPLSSSVASTNGHSHRNAIEVDSPIVIVGGGPVGMVLALTLARIHKLPCSIIEREKTTTPFPKMEFTNGRSMEIYRALGLVDDLRKTGNTVVPEHYSMDEIIVTSLGQDGKLLHVWERDGPKQQREKSQKINDGSQYLEPHMRGHQIVVEKWLKDKVDAEPLIKGYWGTTFLSLQETSDSVVVDTSLDNGDTMRLKAQYVIGADGGGSRVRDAVHLESKRESIDFAMAFVHFRSAKLQEMSPFQRAWHISVIGGGVLINQNEKDTWTCHYTVPPGVDHTTLTPDQMLQRTFGGTLGEIEVPYDEILCRGIWKVQIAVADSFTSASGRVFLIGDAAHQLSPIGGHGLNSGIGDAFDLAWKLAAKEQGWAGDKLMPSYDVERRQVAHRNLNVVREALSDVWIPVLVGTLETYGPEVLNGDDEKSKRAREEVGRKIESGYWIHNQNSNMLGTPYEHSPIIIEEPGKRPWGTHEIYVPTTWPGSRAPHVWLPDGSSTIDSFDRRGFNIVDFSSDGRLGKPLLQAAKDLDIPIKEVRWPPDPNVRTVYERDLLLIRPDGYVAWRSPAEIKEPLSQEQAASILRVVTGH